MIIEKILVGYSSWDISGYNSSPLKIVTPNEANSDKDSNEDNPGHGINLLSYLSIFIHRKCVELE
jgi:hypothetical protein